MKELVIQSITKFLSFDYKFQLVLALIIRVLLILYSVYHDAVFTVPYTDVDYKVFTDASRYILDGKSPYQRHTYRYSPLLAIVLIPNVLVSSLFGKLLFSTVDLFVALLIRRIIIFNIEGYATIAKFSRLYLKLEKYLRDVSDHKEMLENRRNLTIINLASNFGMFIWLYNPLTIAIATRGNCDSLAGFLVLSTIFLIQCKKKYFLAGIVHGLAIHFRLYPIFYSLTFFMYLSNYSYYIKANRPSDPTSKKTIFKKKYLFYLIPNKNQFFLVLGCLVSLTFFTGMFYDYYGYTFVYETYLYHFVRKDTRHNFSLYFYLQYLTAYIKNTPLWQKVLIILPQLVLNLVLSVRYGLDRISMNFGILVQTIVIVSFNTVLTSQYFVWILVILPLSLWQIKMSYSSALLWITIWFLAQGTWLFPAYLLEFKGQNTFFFIWLQSVAFFCANIAILGRLIMHHKPYNIPLFGEI